MAKMIESVKQTLFSDPILFINKLIKVEHPTKGNIAFQMYPFQEDVIRETIGNRYLLINKGRQMGVSTLVSAYCVYKMVTTPGYKILVLATSTRVASNLIAKVKFMLQNLPSWMSVEALHNNQSTVKLANGSSIIAVSSKPESARSEALSLLVIDEAAFIDRAEEVWTAASPTLATGGDCIMLSTPNGFGNFFAVEWFKAKEGNSSFKALELQWHLHPERNKNYLEEEIVKLGYKKALQENCCDFISSGDTVVEGEILTWYRDNYVKTPLFKEGPGSNLWIWEQPQSNSRYMVVVDVARGDGKDFSAFHVLEFPTLKQVGEYKGKISPEDLGRYAVSIAMRYNNALLSIENASVGYASVAAALPIYNNLFYSPRNWQNQTPYIDYQNDVPGFTTSNFTRPLMINCFEQYVSSKQVIIQSERFIDEAFVFIWKNGKAQAQEGFNDDLIMSFSQAPFLLQHAMNRVSAHARSAASDLSSLSVSYMKLGRTEKQDPWMRSVNGHQLDLRDLL